MEEASIVHGPSGSPEKLGSAARFASPSRPGGCLTMAGEMSGSDLQAQAPGWARRPRENVGAQDTRESCRRDESLPLLATAGLGKTHRMFLSGHGRLHTSPGRTTGAEHGPAGLYTPGGGDRVYMVFAESTKRHIVGKPVRAGVQDLKQGNSGSARIPAEDTRHGNTGNA